MIKMFRGVQRPSSEQKIEPMLHFHTVIRERFQGKRLGRTQYHYGEIEIARVGLLITSVAP